MHPRRTLLAVIAGLFVLGEVLAGLSLIGAPHAHPSPLFVSALAGSAIAFALTRALPGKERLAALALLPAYFLASRMLGDLAMALNPIIYDGASAVADASLGFSPAFVVGRVAARAEPVLRWAHLALPVGASLVLAAELTGRGVTRRRRDVAVAFVIAGLVAGVLFHADPTMGPRHAFPSGFPHTAPDVLSVPLGSHASHDTRRTTLVSVDVLWALLLYWYSRGVGPGRWPQIGAGALLALAIVAPLASGDHYAVDLVASVPVAVAIRAALARDVPLGARARWMPLAAGAAWFALWVVLLRAAPRVFLHTPSIGRVLVILTLASSLWLESALTAAESSSVAAPAGEPEEPDDEARVPMPRARAAVLAMFFASGFAGLVYEVMFAKSLALVFGSTATASTTVLATYMGGMSLGSWIGGRLGARTRRPLVLYAACEGGIAVACAIAPFLFGALRAVYVALAHDVEPGSPALTALRVALGAALLLPPTMLMGMTLPLLGKQLAVESSGLGKAVGALYGANTLGAAAGALFTGYVLLQYLGVLRTTLLAVVLNLGVVLVALRWAKRAATDAAGPTARSDAEETGVNTPAARLLAARTRVVGLVVLGAGGVVTLALEGVYTHLLAVVAGNSTFAFAAMLCCFLVGLGLGSSLGRAWLRQAWPAALGVGVAQALVALSVLGGVFLWNVIPSYFGAFEGYPLVREFSAREVVRFLVCAVELVPPALFIGASFPLAMECVGQAVRGDRVGVLGRAAAINTLGNIAGALLGGFVLLPRLGSLRALQVLGATSLVLAFVPLLVMARRDRAHLAIPVALAALVLALQPASFDLTRLANGANVYFTPQGWGDVIDHAESADGGLTTVSVGTDDTHTVKTLLTNGKFQGNDEREIKAQISFALVPLLHTTARDRALVIGFGTGTSARIESDAGFAQVDVAELSRDIAALADRHFASLNRHVLSRPSVHLHVTDGRNFLLVQPRTYDLVTMEITSIWFAGAASLYDVEFYELVKKRLAPGGVLQQWVQLHHLAPTDYVAILSSLRSVFGSVWLYEAGGQGILVACDGDCAPTPAALARIDQQPSLAEALADLGGGARGLLRNRVLTPESVDRLLTAAGATPATLGDFASTDDNLSLEYSTPRGNARAYDETVQRNMATFRAFAPPSELAGTHLTAAAAPAAPAAPATGGPVPARP